MNRVRHGKCMQLLVLKQYSLLLFFALMLLVMLLVVFFCFISLSIVIYRCGFHFSDGINCIPRYL
jgi:hypothetical protein